jgi:uncharacterized membrane protein YphA (DoxX/SURF4 family)
MSRREPDTTPMATPLEQLAAWASARRTQRGFWLFIVNLRFLLGFALLPAGLKKVLGEPFTDPANSGPFHDFLDAFHATGFFYTFVGLLQVLASLLLLTQRRAGLGLVLFMPMITAILVFCWSTAVYPTAIVVTLMTLGGLALCLWHLPELLRLQPVRPPAGDLRIWGHAGLALFLFWVGTVVVQGGVYRPRGFEPENPAFWSLPALLVFPIVAWFIERRLTPRG